MKSTNFENYHSLKLIEALTSIIDHRDISREVVDYLKHTLIFIPWNSGIADAWIEVLKMINSHLGQLVSIDNQQNELQELILEVETISQRFEILEIIIHNDFTNYQYEQAMEHVNRQLDLVELAKRDDLINRAHRNKGAIFHALGQVDEAAVWYKEAYDLIDTIDDDQLIDQTIYTLANLNQHYLANFETARELYLEGYELAVKTEDKERQAFYLDHVGMTEYELENYKQAIDFHHRN